MPQLSAWQKAEILARLRFCSSGLKVKLYGNCAPITNLSSEEIFKAWAQMAIFVMGPYLN